MTRLQRGIITTALLFFFDIALAVGSASNTAIADASSTGSLVNGSCTSTHRGIYAISLHFVCILKRQGSLEDIKDYELSIEANSSGTTDYVQASKTYNCLYCVRNESRFDFRGFPEPAQFDAQNCEGSGYPPGGGPPNPY